jgi:prepilin-type N-terminal cleavage/methylation domain-containing protein
VTTPVRRLTGFTLIELLIVVAIIAILAAIAVPNFLEAQVRAKVSRAQNDLRTLATAIESYIVDHNSPPREYDTSTYNDPLIQGQQAGGIVFPGNATMAGLSTPIAYISQAWMFDPFASTDTNIPFDERTFTYQAISIRIKEGFPIYGGPEAMPVRYAAHDDFYGAWRIMSIGPDKTYFNNLANPASRGGINYRENIVYDPTNGTVSEGNIWRSQKRSTSEQPPVRPGLLAAH